MANSNSILIIFHLIIYQFISNEKNLQKYKINKNRLIFVNNLK
jgi:hypothetical protein